jgi:hypothetical protein
MRNHIGRRDFITILGGAAVASSCSWPRVARAQQPSRIKRIGYVGGHVEDAYGQALIAALRQANGQKTETAEGAVVYAAIEVSGTPSWNNGLQSVSRGFLDLSTAARRVRVWD